MTRTVVILGGGGHGRVVFDTLCEMGVAVLGVLDPKPGLALPAGLRQVGTDLTAISPSDCVLAMGIGSVDVGTRNPRPRAFDAAKAAGFTFITVRHPSSIVTSDVKISEGAQIMAGSIVQPGTILGCNVILNTRSAVDHDCQIGDHVHIAPGAILSGGVVIGAGAHIGTGAIVIQQVTIGSEAMIGAGAFVTRSVPASARVRSPQSTLFVGDNF